MTKWDNVTPEMERVRHKKNGFKGQIAPATNPDDVMSPRCEE